MDPSIIKPFVEMGLGVASFVVLMYVSVFRLNRLEGVLLDILSELQAQHGVREAADALPTQDKARAWNGSAGARRKRE